MKGIVFTEFFKHVEHQHGEEVLDDVIVAADLPHGGAYTSVGTYPFDEMLSLVGAYTKAIDKPVAAVLDRFGQHCFASWVGYVPAFFGPDRHLFDILSEINEFHEQEVRKLYPDAELPVFTVESRNEAVLVIGYHSPKRLTDLAVGVIKGTAAHLGKLVEVTVEPVVGLDESYSRLRINLMGNCNVPGSTSVCPARAKT